MNSENFVPYLVWRDEPPDKEGWWWWEQPDDGEQWIVYVYAKVSRGHPLFFFFDFGEVAVEKVGGCWAGPLPVPTDPVVDTK